MLLSICSYNGLTGEVRPLAPREFFEEVTDHACGRSGWLAHGGPAMRTAILAACTDTSYVFIDGLHFEPRQVDEFSKRRATLDPNRAVLSLALTCRPRKAAEDCRSAPAHRPIALCVLKNGPLHPACLPAGNSAAKPQIFRPVPDNLSGPRENAYHIASLCCGEAGVPAAVHVSTRGFRKGK